MSIETASSAHRYRRLQEVDSLLTGLVIFATFLGFFVFATLEVAALLYGDRVVPIRLRRLLAEGIVARGWFRVIGLIFWSALAIFVEGLVVSLVLGRNGPLDMPTAVLLWTELSLAIGWSYVWIRSCRRAMASKTQP